MLTNLKLPEANQDLRILRRSKLIKIDKKNTRIKEKNLENYQKSEENEKNAENYFKIQGEILIGNEDFGMKFANQKENQT